MPRDELPPWAVDEEMWAQWCSVHGFDETAAAWAEFEAWMDGDR